MTLSVAIVPNAFRLAYDGHCDILSPFQRICDALLGAPLPVCTSEDRA
jgi:hypothetical protein